MKFLSVFQEGQSSEVHSELANYVLLRHSVYCGESEYSGLQRYFSCVLVLQLLLQFVSKPTRLANSPPAISRRSTVTVPTHPDIQRPPQITNLHPQSSETTNKVRYQSSVCFKLSNMHLPVKKTYANQHTGILCMHVMEYNVYNRHFHSNHDFQLWASIEVGATRTVIASSTLFCVYFWDAVLSESCKEENVPVQQTSALELLLRTCPNLFRFAYPIQ